MLACGITSWLALLSSTMNEKCPFLSKTWLDVPAHNPYKAIIEYRCLQGKPMILCNLRCMYFNKFNKFNRDDTERKD